MWRGLNLELSIKVWVGRQADGKFAIRDSSGHIYGVYTNNREAYKQLHKWLEEVNAQQET